ncbi:XRE family transcriptional regulator [Apilactobacillus micheneri]|uniref:helix-turn-helix domain-containing protein n=1 Tax=Apilactobacillus micheneri TaxID=1899430 RepID=UPI00112B79AF|nr:helix-turn-helix transcriptional regulator [Apilactobacillus micheneri]TPR48527.1 XRE family transcriptional regulator [Apilactobacillus micheneri]
MRLIGQRLRVIRLSKDISIESTAQNTALTKKAIKQFESGYNIPQIQDLYQFSQYYQVPLNSLVPEKKLKSQMLTYNIFITLLTILYLLITSFGNLDVIDCFLPIGLSGIFIDNIQIHNIAKNISIKDPIFSFIAKYTNHKFAKALIWILLIISILIFIVNTVKFLFIKPIITTIVLLIYLAFFTALYFKKFKKEA